MRTSKTIKSKIDWHTGGEGKHSDTETILGARKHYFRMLRSLLLDLKNLGKDDIDEVFDNYNVHFVDIDDIERVNIDEPK